MQDRKKKQIEKALDEYEENMSAESLMFQTAKQTHWNRLMFRFDQILKDDKPKSECW